jgi:hypothetical protein
VSEFQFTTHTDDGTARTIDLRELTPAEQRQLRVEAGQAGDVEAVRTLDKLLGDRS